MPVTASLACLIETATIFRWANLVNVCREIIADKLSASGWSWGCVSAVDSKERTIFVVDAHRGDGKRFVVHPTSNAAPLVAFSKNPKPLRLSMDFASGCSKPKEVLDTAAAISNGGCGPRSTASKEGASNPSSSTE